MSSGPRKSKKVTARARRKAPATRPRATPRKQASPPALVVPPLALDFPFGLSFSEVHCLACGELVVSVDGCEPCPHLLYVYLDDVCEPIFVHPVFEELLEESEGAEDDEGDELGFLDRVQQLLGARRSATGVRLAITTGGMACGPVWSTIHVGFELQGVDAWLGGS